MIDSPAITKVNHRWVARCMYIISNTPTILYDTGKIVTTILHTIIKLIYFLLFRCSKILSLTPVLKAFHFLQLLQTTRELIFAIIVYSDATVCWVVWPQSRIVLQTPIYDIIYNTINDNTDFLGRAKTTPATSIRIDKALCK